MAVISFRVLQNKYVLLLYFRLIESTGLQVIEVEKPRSLYVVNSDVYNEGMKYTDTFFVATRFCMFQRDAKHSFFRVTAEVKYVKNVNAIIKCKANLYADRDFFRCVDF